MSFMPIKMSYLTSLELFRHLVMSNCPIAMFDSFHRFCYFKASKQFAPDTALNAMLTEYCFPHLYKYLLAIFNSVLSKPKSF